MKFLLFILCLFALSCDSGDTGQYIYGCTSPAACNFDSDATLSDATLNGESSCYFPEVDHDCDGNYINLCTGVWTYDEFNLIFSEECICGSNDEICDDGDYNSCTVITILQDEEDITVASCECNASNCQSSYFYECIEDNIIFNDYTFIVNGNTATMEETKTIEQFSSTFNFSPSVNHGGGCMVTSSIVLNRE